MDDYESLFKDIEKINEDHDKNKDNLLQYNDYTYDDDDDDDYNEDDVDMFLSKIMINVMLSKKFKDIIYYLGTTDDDYECILDRLFKDEEYLCFATTANCLHVNKWVGRFMESFDEISQEMTIIVTTNNQVTIEIMINSILYIRTI